MSATIEAGQIIIQLVTDFDNVHEVTKLIGTEIEIGAQQEEVIEADDWVVTKDNQVLKVEKILSNGNYVLKVASGNVVVAPSNVRKCKGMP